MLPGFIAGSFYGAALSDRLASLGSLPPVVAARTFRRGRNAGGAVCGDARFVRVYGASAGATDALWKGREFTSLRCCRGITVLNLIIAGQPWSSSMGSAVGPEIATCSVPISPRTPNWGREAQQTHIESSLLTDVTSVTNIGLLIGALIAANFRGRARPVTNATGKQWLVALITGLVLGYSARLAFGCNVGAYFAGISTGSLHGWVWLAAAFAGSFVGIPLRDRLGLKR